MSRYQHTKGQIKDNAIEALLHDPLFRQRVEKNKKGKGSYMRKGKHGNRGNCCLLYTSPSPRDAQ